ncbi:MAG: CHAT domain-containing protein [Thermoanaerobaculia bacterium]
MKKLSLFAIALCTCATFFCERDTKSEKEWPRDVEPRLSNASSWRPCRAKGSVLDRVVQETECEAAVPERPLPCWYVEDLDSARRALSSQPRCINDAIDVLKKHAPTSAKVTSDLAAAFYVRAQRNDEPADLLEALTQVNIAVKADPLLPEARFNRALILETLGASDEAIAAWNEFLAVGEGEWRNEATARRNRLTSRVPDFRRWQSIQKDLATALRRHDLGRVQTLIEPFPSAAQRYFEEDLLLQWAKVPTDEHFAQVSLFAQALSRRLNDPFAVDTVAAIARAKDKTALRAAHRTYAENRRIPGQVPPEDLFANSDSPFRLLVQIRRGKEATTSTYPYLTATAHWHQALLLSYSEFINSLDRYEKARAAFASMRDEEALTAIHSRMAGVYGVLGDRRANWREVFYAQRYQHRLIHPKNRTAHNLEIALAARRLGHVELALSYLNPTVVELDNAADISNLTIALRHRAQAAMDLGDMAAAERDLVRLAALPQSENVDKNMAVWLEARDAELLGQKSLKDATFASAISEFSKALDKTPEVFTTLRALLRVERAEAYERAEQSDAALRDLEAATVILQGEGSALLAHRDATEAEKAWRPYFERFQDTYRALIRLLMQRSDVARAFAYAEQARAAEPLNLVGRGPATVLELQQKLPPNTYLLEYCVTDDETFIWLVGRETLRTFPAVGRKTVEAWSSRLQDAVQKGRTDEFGIVVGAAYESLVAGPLAYIPPEARIVVIPDGALHALPFEAFRDEKGQYLIQRNVLESSGSAALYLHSLRRDETLPSSNSPSVLAIGNPDFDKNLPFAEELELLPFAQKEAGEIRDLYQNGHELIGRDATVSAFLAHAPRYQVVHVAAHAVVNAQEPSHSMIFLAKSQDHRGGLEPPELLRHLKLDRTRLVVLSVCSGAGGLPIGAEGVAPLVRPILAAGAPAVIGNLWTVIDNATTEELMVSFHAQYVKGSDAATALRAAQVAAIKNNKPVMAWAGFQVIGHASSPFAPRAPAPGGNSIGIHTSNSLQRPDRLRSQ